MRNKFRSIVLLLLGVVLGILPVFAAHVAVRSFVLNRGEEFLNYSAQSTLQRAEDYVQETIDVFSALPHYWVPVCDADFLKRLKGMMLRHEAIHDIGLIYNNNYMYCSSMEESSHFSATSSRVPGSVPHLSFGAVTDNVTEKDGLMVQWRISDYVSLGGFILLDSFYQQSQQTDYAESFRMVLKLNNGEVITTSTPETRLREKAPFYEFENDPAWTRDLIKQELSSSRYPISVVVEVPFDAVWQSLGGLVNVVDGFGVLTGALIMFFFVRMGLRKPDPYVSLQKAIRRKEFIPYYQPILDIQSGRLAGCEVLVRWKKPDGTIASPGHFIDIAEATGLAQPMTSLLMAQVAQDLSESYADHRDLKVAINLFNKHFDDLEIIREVQHVFGNSGVRFDQLVFEITERLPLENLDRARAIIARMQELGIRIALDDAGTGHGGFTYLQKLGMDIIKIDKLFVDTIRVESKSVPIIDSLNQMAKGLDMVVVAEGVETDEQLDYLRRLGVDEAQGFLFSPALPASAYLQLIKALGSKSGKKKASAKSSKSDDKARKAS
nr:EAL domain-containing protein [uncultured Cohaesibacter sp.]